MRSVVLIVTLLLAFAYPPPTAAQRSYAIIPGVGVPGVVVLGQDRDSLEQVLGKSDRYRCTSTRTSIKENRASTSKTVIKSWVGVQKYRSFYDTLSVFVNYGVSGRKQFVRSVEFVGSNYATDKGISVGSTVAQVISTYGPLQNGRAYYPDSGVEFTINEDRVEAIIVSRL